MKLIKKGKEPKSLTIYKKQNNAYYDGCNKLDIRKSLLDEQGYLCAYCMKRIDERNMTIEHYNAQSKISSKEALNYNMMLAVCLGGRGETFCNQTCDAHKGNTKLTVNPLSESSINLIKYKQDGTIYSDDPDINNDLNNTLNLNCGQSNLKENRKSVLDALKRYLSKMQSNGTWKKQFLEKIKNKYETKNSNGKYEEYCGIVIYYLSNRIK